MRRGIAIRGLFLALVAACAHRSSATAPTTPASAGAPTVYRWYCFADASGAGTDCARSLGECTDAAQEWANDDQDGDGVGDNQSTPCTGQQVAYCYSYVPDDSTSGNSLTMCQQTMDSCQSSAGLSEAKSGTQTACAETE